MPLELKVKLTQQRIREFVNQVDGAYVSFSGGKDSTVLLDIARKIYPDIPAVFSNTGLEYPEIRQFATAHDNVEVVAPKVPFTEVISLYGYPLIGKEVAEAIYYARRLQPVERERAGGRASDPYERFSQPPDNSDGCVPAFHTHTHTSGRTTKHHRTELAGERSYKGNSRRTKKSTGETEPG